MANAILNFHFFKPFPKSVSVAIHLLFRYYRYIKRYFEDQCWRVFITIEEKPWNWVPRLCDIILELMHFLSFLHKIVLILPPDRFQDKILESPQCRHVRLCMSRVPWKYLLHSSLFTYFTPKWNSIGNHAYGDSNPPHNDFSSFAAPQPWSMTKYENSP